LGGQRAVWSKPSFVLSSYTGRLEQEDATGRFHASLACRREIFDRIGGWPLTRRGDFDQQLSARINAIEAPGNPCRFADASYIFRRGQTNAYHGQAFIRGRKLVVRAADRTRNADHERLDFAGTTS
jgi:hypothetical protein